MRTGLQNANVRHNRQYLLMGCYFGEQVDGPRGPRAARELVFSHKYKPAWTTKLSSTGGRTRRTMKLAEDCYEIAATYTGLGDYTYCSLPMRMPVRWRLAPPFHTFEMADFVAIPRGKWSDYRSVPPTPDPRTYSHRTPDPTPHAHSDSHSIADAYSHADTSGHVRTYTDAGTDGYPDTHA